MRVPVALRLRVAAFFVRRRRDLAFFGADAIKPLRFFIAVTFHKLDDIC